MKFSSVVFLILLLGANVYAQSTTGTLTGTVRDFSDLPVAGVSVVAKHLATNSFRTATTSETGVYSISNLEAGTYRIDFQKDLFKTAQVTVPLQVNETRRVDVPMVVGAISEVVEVQGTFPLLQKGTSAIGYVLGEHEISQYPVLGRQIENLLKLLPGIVASAPNSQLSSRGGVNAGGLDEHYLSLLIDGMDDLDPVIRSFNYKPPLDFIEAIRVEQNGYSPEFGRNGGVVVNIATKSGTNALHADAWEFFRNDNLDARNVFATDVPKPPLIRNQFGGTLGGALKRDKTFFFIGAEILRQKTGTTRRATVPTEKMRLGDFTELATPVLEPSTRQPFPGNIIPDSRINSIARDVLSGIPHPNRPGLAKNRLEVADRIDNGFDFTGRIDHHLFAGTRLMGRYSTNVTRVLDPFRTDTTGGSNLSEFGQTADRFRTSVALSAATAIGQSMVNEFRAGFSRFRQPQLPLNPGTPAQQPLMGFVKAFLSFRVGSFDAWGSNTEFKRAVNVYNYTDSLTYVRGSHQYRVGADVRRYLLNAYNVGPNTFVFSGLRSNNAMADFLLGEATQILTSDGNPYGNTRKFEFAAYAQDDWKVTPRLTLNYGLRWEYYGRMTEKINKQSNWDPDCGCMLLAGKDAPPGLVGNDWNNFAPRLGLAWRPFDERTVVRASSGIFYDNDQRHNTELVTNFPFFTSREYMFPASLTAPFSPPFAPATLRPNALEKDFHDTYVEQWSLGVQREVATGLLAEVAYVANHSVKARQVRNVNQPLNGVTPYSTFGTINLFEQAGSSNYNALQVRVERRLAKGIGFLSSYTWGHAIDDRPGQGTGPSQNYYNRRAERASADFDVRHNWVVSGTYQLPFGEGRRWGGWSLNAISTAQSGRPFTVIRSVQVSSFTATRPDVVPGVSWKPADQSPDHWINPLAFGPPATEFGTLGRNTLTGPGLYNLDVSVIKSQRFGDKTLQFRSEFFNVLNHPNFGLPNNQFGSPTLGVISSTVSPERQVQFGIKLSY